MKAGNLIESLDSSLMGSYYAGKRDGDYSDVLQHRAFERELTLDESALYEHFLGKSMKESNHWINLKLQP